MQHSVYLHIPFCIHRCAYCDFNTYAGQEDLIPAYVDALCREIHWVGASAPQSLIVHTIYFGGGTPSLLSPRQFDVILGALNRSFQVSSDAEITVEANPGTVSADGLQDMRRLGINRLSLGVQSANGEELRTLERQHTYLDVLEAVSSARRAGFDNVSLDLIYGLPEQTLETWQLTVERVLQLEPDHLSAYALTLEHGTPFGRWTSRGLMPSPNVDLAADMYEWLSERLSGAGYSQYEISNWGRDGSACRHNLQYWRALPYLGLGAGAHGYAGGYRYSNVLRIRSYVDRMQNSLAIPAAHDFPASPAAVNQHRQSVDDDASEFMIMGLRLTDEGISTSEFKARFGVDLTDRYRKELADLLDLGLLEHVPSEPAAVPARGGGRVRLSPRGRLLGNQVFVRFVN